MLLGVIECFNYVSRDFRILGVSCLLQRMCQECYKEAKRVFERFFKGVLWVFHGSSVSVAREI